MLLEDSKKLEKLKSNLLEKEDAQAFVKRKKRLKDEMVIDLDARQKKQAGRPKGSNVKKEQNVRARNARKS